MHTLWDTIPPHNGTPTSRAGARKASGRAALQKPAILACVRSAGPRGMTRQDIAAATGLPLASVCGRVWTLRAKGLLAEDGVRDGRAVLVMVECGTV